MKAYIVKLYIVTGIVMGFMSIKANAQYEQVRFPQKPEEIALFKKNKVMGETQFGVDSGKKVPYLTRAFDTGGRVVISQDYNHIKYYKYDEKGNMIEFLDSVRIDKTHFRADDYKFTYDENGLLKKMEGPDSKSIFTYNAKRKILTEKFTKNDTTTQNRYYYNAQGRMRESIFYSPEFYRTAHVVKNYSADGRLNNEAFVQLSPNSSDSTLEIFEYDAQNHLEKKEVFRFVDFKYSTNGSSKPNRSASHYGVATYQYDLDNEGRPVAEEYSVKNDKLNYSYSTWAYDKNGLITKDTYLYAHGEPKTTQHVYYYFDK